MKLEELKALEIRDNAHLGKTAQIPTLEEVIAFAKDAPNQIGLLIEVKSTPDNAEQLKL